MRGVVFGAVVRHLCFERIIKMIFHFRFSVLLVKSKIGYKAETEERSKNEGQHIYVENSQMRLTLRFHTIVRERERKRRFGRSTKVRRYDIISNFQFTQITHKLKSDELCCCCLGRMRYYFQCSVKSSAFQRNIKTNRKKR